MWHWKCHVEHKRGRRQMSGAVWFLSQQFHGRSSLILMLLCHNGYANSCPWLDCWWIMNFGNSAGISLYSLISFLLLPITGFFLMRIPTFSDEISALPQELTELLWSMHPRFPGKQHKLASATPVSCHFVTHTMRFFSFPSAITLHLTICIVCQDHGKDLFLRCKYTYTHTYKLVLSYS